MHSYHPISIFISIHITRCYSIYLDRTLILLRDVFNELSPCSVFNTKSVTMVVIRCPYPECEFETPDIDVIGAAGASTTLDIHARVHPLATAAVAPQPPTPKIPSLERPKIQLNSSPEEWNAFVRRWKTYKSGSHINDNVAPGQLLECTSKELGNIVLRAHPNFTSKPLDEVLPLLRSLAVVPVALGVLRSELTAMTQDPDEPFRTFAAKVQGKAETCELTTNYTGTCTHCNTEYQGTTYYTENRIRDVLLNGIADMDIRREALSVDNIHNRSINEVIAFVEGREIARNANPVVGISAVSRYRENLRAPDNNNSNDQNNSNGSNNRSNRSNRSRSPSAADRARTSPCPDCGNIFHLFSRTSRGWNRRPHERCKPCWQRNLEQQQNNSGQAGALTLEQDPIGQISIITESTESVVADTTAPSSPRPRRRPRARRRRKKKPPEGPTHIATVNSTDDEASTPARRHRRPRRRKRKLDHNTVGPPQTTAVESDPNEAAASGPRRRRRRRRHKKKPPSVVTLTHHIFTKGEWRRARLADHPRVELSIAPNRTPTKETCVNGIADSGAQSNVWDLNEYLEAGYRKEDLSPVNLSLNAANKSAIKIDGAFFSEISGTATDGSIIKSKAMIYVSSDVRGFFLSYSTMVDLGMISRDFPRPGSA